MIKDYSDIKKNMIAVKYRREQELTCNQGIEACQLKNLAVELYTGKGGLTELYKKSFKEVVTNDLNKDSVAEYNLPAIKFIEIVLPNLPKIDMIDFDCYGCPALEIQKYFEVRKNIDAPFVLRLSDGLGLWMKRNKKQDVIKKRYLIDENIDMTKIWLRHEELINSFLKKISAKYNMKTEKIISVQTKFKNYVLGAWLFTNE